MEWLDADVGSLNGSFQKAPVVFESVGMNVFDCIGFGMVTHAVKLIGPDSGLGSLGMTVAFGATPHVPLCLLMKSGAMSVGYKRCANTAARLEASTQSNLIIASSAQHPLALL